MADDQGQTPLHVAAGGSSLDCVIRLLTAGADVTARSNVDFSALDYAVIRGHAEVADVILRHGVQINGADTVGMTALHKAAAHNAADSIKFLITKGAIVDVEGEDGAAPLMMAASEGHSCAAVLALLQHGANVNARDVDKSTPLHGAVTAEKLDAVGDTVSLLLQWDANEMAVDVFGQSAL